MQFRFHFTEDQCISIYVKHLYYKRKGAKERRKRTQSQLMSYEFMSVSNFNTGKKCSKNFSESDRFILEKSLKLK